MKNFSILHFALFLLWSFQARAIPQEGHRMMISAPSQYAVIAGREIIAQGGNVVDVAVAVGLTLSVTSPYFASLGGGGFALVKMNSDKVKALDFRETAPQATHTQTYVGKPKKSSQKGGLSVGVPGFPAGLWALHKKYGKLPWKKLFKTPLQLANKGFQVSGEWVHKTKSSAKDFNLAAKKFFYKNFKKQTHYRPGETLIQRPLGRVLKKLKAHNIKGFYSGAVAQDIVTTVRNEGGVISLKDFANYKVRWLTPLTHSFAGHQLHLMPPPSSGGVVMKSFFSMAETLQLSKHQSFSVDELHLMSELLSRAFRGRSLLGDPDFHKNPLSKILGSQYLKQMAQSISIRKTKKLKPLKDSKPKYESPETTHYTVMDSQGNAVSLTVTLNLNYGSGVVSEKYGIALNDEMDDFTTQPGQPNAFGLIQGSGNYVQAGKRPLSSMSPTLVTKKGRTVLALGGKGGPRIISGVIQSLYRHLVSGLDIDAAIQAPRVHHQFLPHQLIVDPKLLQPATLKGLEKKGHLVKKGWMSKIYGITLSPDGTLKAAFDARSEGAAGGL